MEKDTGFQRTALLLSLLASLLYGSQYVVIKDGMGEISPFLFGALTVSIGGLLALLVVRRRKRLDLSIFRHWEVWAGMLAASSMIACQYVGLTLSSASVGGLIVGSNVIFVAPLSALIFREVIGWRRAIGVAIDLFGLFTITTGWDLSSISSSAFLGDILLLGASFSIAATYPLTKFAARHMGYDEWVMSFHLLSAIPLLALMLLGGGPGDVSSISLPALLYVGLLCTSVPTMLWAIGLKSLSLTTSATVLLSESAFAVLLGAVVLNEPLGPLTVLGAMLVFAAIVLAVQPGRPQKPQKEEER
jgi:drug/metabolite transporter (DMT)-like permease